MTPEGHIDVAGEAFPLACWDAVRAAPLEHPANITANTIAPQVVTAAMVKVVFRVVVGTLVPFKTVGLSAEEAAKTLSVTRK